MARYLVRVWFGDPDAAEPNSGQQSHLDLRLTTSDQWDALDESARLYDLKYSRRYGWAPIVGVKIIWAGGASDKWGGVQAIPRAIKPDEPLPPPPASDTPRRPRGRKAPTAARTSGGRGRGGRGRRRA